MGAFPYRGDVAVYLPATHTRVGPGGRQIGPAGECRRNRADSGQDRLDHLAVHVRQAALDAVVVVRQPLWSMPSRCSTVAWKSCQVTGSSAAFQPTSSVAP